MNKFKKAILGLVAAAGVSCLCGVAACSAPKYYQLIFEGSGIDYVLQDKLAEFENGGTVKKGVEVRFTVSLGANTLGEPVITLSDGTTLTPDENGVYSFVMNGATKVSASGLNGIYTVTLDKFETVLNAEGQYVRQECRIHYLDEQGNDLGDEVRLEGGTDFKFKLDISPYYVQSCSVNCGYEVLDADANGVYTVENVTSDATVKVSGLVQEEAFFFRKNCGTGTEDDPYLLSRPIDMYYLAVVVNSSYYVNYRYCHYKLADDIDMQGEQLFVIGDMSHDNAAFMGSFDGNGKTISNFYITDEVIDQQSFENEYLTSVGLFGRAVATNSSPVVIKNLTLKDYEVRVHPGESQTRSISGSVLGEGIGVQITNCHADGEIIAFGDDNQIIFTGGIAGYLQAAYGSIGSSIITYDSFVRSCSTNVRIEGTGSPRAAGGIVGYLVSADINAIAYVVNSYSTGDIYGAMHAGGIVGTMGRYTSVSNCYSTSVVSASNTVATAMATSDYMVAYAGGIAGFADEDSVISSCYVANAKLSANSVHGASYQDVGKNYDGIIGHAAEKGSVAVNSAGVVLYNNLPKRSGATSAMFTETLGWTEYDWVFTGDLPTIQPVAGILNEKRELTVKVKPVWGGFESTYSYEVSERPPIHEWYSQNKLPVYATNDNGDKLSWGYYFDSALTKKVPYGFVPAAKQTTLYVGFADYGEVAGTYYVSDATYSNGAYIQLDNAGNVFFRNGGLTYRSRYVYDGDEITLIDSALSNLLYTMEEINGGYCTFRGVKTDDGFTVSGKTSMIDLENSTADSQTEVIREMKFSVVKASSTFAYGEYLAGNGATYSFNRGGTGVFINARKVRQSFTYTISGNQIDIVYDGANGGATATLENGKVIKVGNDNVQLKDGLAGVWLTAANSGVSFEFDGFGKVKYTANGTVTNTTYNADGAFTINSVNYKAEIKENGVLDVNGKEYYLSDGFTGTWYFSYGKDNKERIEVTLEGIGRNGYGYATISYAGSKVASVDAQYDVFTDSYGTSLRLFVDDRTYGELSLDSISGKATGLFYSLHNSAYYTNAEFRLYDNFKGTWVGNTEQIDTITFDGKTASDKAEVLITDANGVTLRGTYVLEGLTVGKVTVGGNVYTLDLDELSGKASLADTQLAKRDEWYGVTLYDASGNSYRFDGRGNLDDGGKVTVSNGTKLTYTVRGGTVTVDGNALTPAGSGFTCGSETLTFKSGFVGEWMISGVDYSLIINEVDSSFKAKVTYSDPAVTGEFDFVFNPSFDASSVALTYTEEVDGERIVTRLSLHGDNEILLTRTSVAGELTRSGIRDSLVDNWKGTYTYISSAEEIESGVSPNKDTSWTFDGLGNAKYGRGKAIFTAADGVKTEYQYRINALGVPCIVYNGESLFVETSGGGYYMGGKYYELITPDALYEREVLLEVAESETLHFIFDGISTLLRKDDNQFVAEYTYVITGDGEVELTEVATGKKYKGAIENRGRYDQLTLTEISEN